MISSLRADIVLPRRMPGGQGLAQRSSVARLGPCGSGGRCGSPRGGRSEAITTLVTTHHSPAGTSSRLISEPGPGSGAEPRLTVVLVPVRALPDHTVWPWPQI